MKLFNGDCLEIMPTLQPQSVDLIIADLPYGTTQCKWDIVIPFAEMWDCINHVAKPNTAVVLFGCEPFASHLRLSNLKNYKYDWIWDKVKGTGFLNAKKQPMRNHELVSVFYKKQPTYNPQKTTGHKMKKSVRGKHLQTDVYGDMKHDYVYQSDERYPRSIQVFSSDTQNSSFHPTQKPLALLEYLIATYSNTGDAVLDFCMGSGTTGLAAKNLGREFIGIEKEQEYFEIAKNRILGDGSNIDLFEEIV